MNPTILFAVALFLPACSSLDPSVGPWRVEQPTTRDAAASDAEQDVEPGVCEGIGPDEVCFARDIRPLMDRSSMSTPKGCRGCHYSTEAKHVGIDLGGLDLSTLGKLRKGGGSSLKRIVVAGKPSESVIVQVLKGQYGYAPRMPKGPLAGFWTPEEIQLVSDWILQGARGIDRE